MRFADRLSDLRRRAALRARERKRAPQTAFVLSGGGVLGAVQAGQLLALAEAGIRPDMLVGTSVGALNAAMIAGDPTVEGARRLAAVWEKLKTDDVFPAGRMALAWHAVARGDHLHPNDGLRKLADQLPIHTFEELAIPLHVCATKLVSGQEHWFTSGELTPVILASTALPAVFPPVEIDGELYLDGGVVNNVPISRAVELGARRIYVLTCAPSESRERPLHRPIDVLLHAFFHARAARFAEDLKRYGGRAEFVIMPTAEPGFVRYNDTSRGAELVGRAYEISKTFLAAQDTVRERRPLTRLADVVRR